MKAGFAVADFGRTMGFDELSLQPLGHIRLGLPSGEWISLEEHDDDLLVGVVAPTPFLETAPMLAALQACEARRPGSDRVFQVGTLGEGQGSCFVLVTRLSADRATGADIGRSVDECLQWLHRWRLETQSTSGRR